MKLGLVRLSITTDYNIQLVVDFSYTHIASYVYDDIPGLGVMCYDRGNSNTVTVASS